jgi:microcystin-dependent protein
MMFGGNFAPRGWAFCDGQLLPISTNSALFSILGTTYGGDGRTTFGLPDLRGRAALHAGHGPGLSNRSLGAKGGAENVTLNLTQIPSHNHPVTVKLKATDNSGDSADPVGRSPAQAGEDIYADSADGQLAPPDVTVGNTGGNQHHENMQPYQVVSYIIALQGIYPSRS